MIFNKIVRDLIRPRGYEKSKHLSPQLRRALLQGKLHEEVAELNREPRNVGEYADVLSVLKDMAHLYQVPWEMVEEVAKAKRELRGGFINGMFVWLPEKRWPKLVR